MLSRMLRLQPGLAVLVVASIAIAAVCLQRSVPDIAVSPLPNDERHVVVEELGTSKYVDPSPQGGFCSTDVFSTYDGVWIAHGLTADSTLPAALIEAVEEVGWPIEEYEHRWFGERRIVLFSASPNDKTKPLFVDAMEIVLIESEGGQRIWSIPYRSVGRPCG